jgi:hypothetical protein
MAESHSAESLRFASSIIAHHGSQALSFAEKVAGDLRAAGREADARQWAFISAAIDAIEMAVPLPDLNPIALARTARPASIAKPGAARKHRLAAEQDMLEAAAIEQDRDVGERIAFDDHQIRLGPDRDPPDRRAVSSR